MKPLTRFPFVIAFSTLCVLFPLSLARADAFSPAFAEADVDLDATGSFHDGKAQPADAEVLATVLGFANGQNTWSAGSVSEKIEKDKTETFQYLLAFKRPVKLGTIAGGTGELRYLKPDAPYPGDPANGEQWIKPDVRRSQAYPQFITLPAGTETRALLCTEQLGESRSRSKIATWWFTGERLLNITPEAVANAKEEYTTVKYPHTYGASGIPAGNDVWIGTGVDNKGRNLRPPVSDIDPSWFVMSWPQPRQISRIYVQDNFQQYKLYTYVGPEGINPAIGTEAEWKLQRAFKELKLQGRWIVFDHPVETRGLRFLILKTTEPQIPKMSAMHVLTELGDQPVPPLVKAVSPHPPLALPYELAADGTFTMVVERPDGSRARNIVGRVQRGKGRNVEYWNLKDEDGQYAQPGTYTWKAITHPPLQLRYEMTAYPNVTMNTADRAPWLTSMSGPDGWMADHTPPRAAATSGDFVFLGSPVSESGVSFITCDLTGRKLWAHPSFAGFTGVWWLAADATTAYVGASACNTAMEWNVEADTEVVWGVDIESKNVRTVAVLPPTSTRKRGIQGMAARDGKVYLSVLNDQGWLQNAAQAADVDIERCVPRYPPKRRERYEYEVVPDPRGDFLRLFRLKSPPPGIVQNEDIIYLESTKGIGQQYILLTFNKPVSLGSVVYPVPQDGKTKVKLCALKENAPYPPNPEDESQWQPFDDSGKLAWDVVPAPPNTRTRALRVGFYTGADDIFSAVENEKTTGAGDDALLGADLDADSGKGDAAVDDKKSWQGRLEGMKLLRRRYVNLFSTAKVMVNSGHVSKDGTWDAERDEPLTNGNPAIYSLQWPKPQSIRGLAINEIDGAKTEIDVFTGPDNAAVDIAAATGWERVGTYLQERRNHWSGTYGYNGQARYLDGYVDFGKEVKTRAVRLRVVGQWGDRGDRGLMGVRADRGGQEINAARCRIYGVAPLQYIGGEDPVDSLITERIEVCDAATGKITQEIGIGKPGPIAFDPAGRLYTISEGKILRVDPAGKDHKLITKDPANPEQITCDKSGNIYIYDAAADRQNIRVYDPAGRYLRSIGTPGGYRPGPWDPTRLTEVSAMAADKLDQLWVVETHYWPKRITLWSVDGTFKREFLGNTPYGGGGSLDPFDKRRIFFGPLEFEIDWDKGTTRLKNLLFWEGGGWEAGDVPTQIDGRTYLTTPRAGGNGPATSCGIVYLYEKDHIRRVAAMGHADSFSPLQKPEVRKALGYKPLPDYEFLWSDLNGDGEVQPGEIELWPSRGRTQVSSFNRDLSVSMDKLRFQVKRFLPNGVPVYEKQELSKLRGGPIYRLDNGNFWCMEDMNVLDIRIVTPEGKTVWTYMTEGNGVGGLNTCGPYTTDQVVCQFGVVGHETAHAGDLGEFLVFNTNLGSWNIFTSDGLLAGTIFHDLRRPCTAWSMAEHQRYLNLDDITVGQEHFAGYFCKTPDNKYYCVAGHNHLSIVEVIGLDRFKRLGGQLAITADDVAAAQAWEREYQKVKVYEKAPVIDCYRLKSPPKIDGDSTDWDFISAKLDREDASFRIGYDDKYLFLCYQTARMGPLSNTGEQWDRLFKTGASVDLQMGLDPQAPADRKAPVAGDFRLLMTYVADEPIAVLYNAVVPGTPKDKVWIVRSPVGQASFDVVKKLTTARIAAVRDDTKYTIEAAIPLADLGIKPKPGDRLKIDWGVLVSGKDGHEVMRRVYWANKATGVIADAPSEARLHPQLWGYLRVLGKHEDVLDQVDPTKDVEKDKTTDGFVDDLIEDLK